MHKSGAHSGRRLGTIAGALLAAVVVVAVVVAILVATRPVTYNVFDYDARANGVADDTPAVQAAVNAAHAAGGGVVYLPAGTYRFDAARTLDPNLGANVELFDNVTVKGAGTTKTFVVAVRTYASAFGAMRKKNVSVQDMNIRSGGSQGDGVKFGVCTNPLVQNVVAHDIYIGIAIYSSTNPVIRNCTAYNNSNAGIAIGQFWPEPSVGGLIEDCQGWGANQYSFRLSGKTDIQTRVTGVTLRRCSSHNDRTGFLLTYAENLKLKNCTSTASGPSGIHLSGVYGATLTDCSPVFVTTADNDRQMFAVYGPSNGIMLK